MQEALIEEKAHPYADLLGINIETKEDGRCRCTVAFDEKLLNPNLVIHGGVIYSLADNGMGGALQSILGEDELCATIEIKITYLHAVGTENLVCESVVLKKGSRVAMLESEIFAGDRLVAKATGSFAVFLDRNSTG